MATFSKFYKARVIKAITGDGLKLWALGTTATGANPAAPTSATLSTSPGPTTLGFLTSGTIPFANLPVTDEANGAEITNSAASSQLTITAGKVVHYIGLSTTYGDVLYAYIKLTTPDDLYYYEEQGTLTVPAGNYKIKHA